MKILLLLLILSFNALGSSCKTSKVSLNNFEPENFHSSSNLYSMKLDSKQFNLGSIILVGRVLSSNCIPISDVKVLLWQTNSEGKYPYKTLRENVNQKLVDNSNSKFKGSGTTFSDNTGKFVFVTEYPGNIGRDSPHVNIRLNHKYAGEIQTKVYLAKPFEESSSCSNLDTYYRISSKGYMVAYPNGENMYYFDIVMPGIDEIKKIKHFK